MNIIRIQNLHPIEPSTKVGYFILKLISFNEKGKGPSGSFLMQNSKIAMVVWGVPEPSASWVTYLCEGSVSAHRYIQVLEQHVSLQGCPR